MPIALATTYCVFADVTSIISAAGVNLRLDDATTDFLSNQGINWGAARINDYCMPRYNPEDLAQSWTVNWWNSVLASRFVCMRRVNPLPIVVKDAYVEAMRDLKDVKAGDYSLGDVDLRVVDSPAWSSVRVPVWYISDRIRVERQRSEGTPRRIVPSLDRLSEFLPKEP